MADTKAAKAAGRVETKEEREHKRAVDAVARRFEGPMRPDLTTAVETMVARGDTSDTIKARLAPQVAARLAKNRGGALSPEAGANGPHGCCGRSRRPIRTSPRR